MDTLAVFDPIETKVPAGPSVAGESVRFLVETDIKCLPNEVYLMLKKDGDSDYQYILMDRNGYTSDSATFCVEHTFLEEGHYFYNFKLNYNDFSKYLSKTYDLMSQILDNKGEDFFQLVIKRNLFQSIPKYLGGTIYQIFVDRFCREGKVLERDGLNYRPDWGGNIKKYTSNPVEINKEVFGGNIAGIIKKLPYLENLGIKAIYLSPISYAQSNHKYDTADYNIIDPMLGTMSDFENLVEEGKKRGISIIIDGVYNHTGSDSIYFNKEKRFDSIGAYNDRNSKYFDWYTFEKYPEKYDCWWGIVTLPSIKKDCKSYQNFIAGDGGVIDNFMKTGIAGIRLDVVDELSDEFVKKINAKVKSYGSDKVVIGEVWEDASTKISYGMRRKYFFGDELTSVMNYPFMNSIISYAETREPRMLFSTVRMIENGYPPEIKNQLMNFLGTHDTGRIFSRLLKISEGDRERAKKFLKIVFGILFTLPGIPCVFYGDEYGMEDCDGSSRGCFDWENKNDDIMEIMKKIMTIRKNKVFESGKMKVLMAENGKFVFERTGEGHILTATNLRESELVIETDNNFVSLFSGEKKKVYKLGCDEIEILVEIE